MNDAPKQPKFKMWERVRAKEDHKSHGIVETVSLDEEGQLFDYRVKTSDGTNFWLPEPELEPFPEPNVIKYPPDTPMSVIMADAEPKLFPELSETERLTMENTKLQKKLTEMTNLYFDSVKAEVKLMQKNSDLQTKIEFLTKREQS